MKEKDLLSELSEIRRAFDEFFVSKNPMMMIADPFWRPPMDVFDTPDFTLARIEVSGMDKEEIEVTLDGDRLIIRGHRPNKQDKEIPSRCYRQMEIKYTTFQREVLLLRPFDADGITATYRDGFLQVKVPATKAKPKATKVRIAVKEEA